MLGSLKIKSLNVIAKMSLLKINLNDNKKYSEEVKKNLMLKKYLFNSSLVSFLHFLTKYNFSFHINQ